MGASWAKFKFSGINVLGTASLSLMLNLDFEFSWQYKTLFRKKGVLPMVIKFWLESNFIISEHLESDCYNSANFSLCKDYTEVIEFSIWATFTTLDKNPQECYHFLECVL